MNNIVNLANQMQLTNILPQIAPFLTPEKLQQLQNQFLSTIVTAVGSNWNAATVSQALQQLITQFVPQAAQMRIDWESVGQSALNGIVTALPSILIGALSLFGKRDLPAGDARGLNDILALADKLPLNNILPQIQSFLTPDKFQQLQTQVMSTVVAALGNHWNAATLGQALQQLVNQFVPQAAQMRIDWESVGQSALNGIVTALPSILIGALSLFGKRALNSNYQQLLSQLPVNQIAQLVQVVLNSDKATVVSKVRQLLQQFLPNLSERINFDDLAAQVLAQLNNLLPILSQSIFSSIFG